MKLKSAWQGNLLRLVKQGYPLIAAARLANIGLEKVYAEKRMNQEFANELNAATKPSQEKFDKRSSW